MLRFYDAVFLLCWYKSTNTDVGIGTTVQILTRASGRVSLGNLLLCRGSCCTQETYITLRLLALLVQKCKYSAAVQRELLHARDVYNTQITCFTGTKVQILCCSAEGAAACKRCTAKPTIYTLRLLALLVQKCKYWRLRSCVGRVSCAICCTWRSCMRDISDYLLYWYKRANTGA
jgi:hypothetical protein